MYTIGDLKDGVAGLLSGTNLDNITGLYGAFERAARKLITKADVPEATIKQSLTLYDAVFDYPISANIFGNALIDVRPQGVDRTVLDTVVKRPIQIFDRTKNLLPSGYEVTFEFNKGTPIVRIATPRPLARVILDTMKETTDWTVGGSIASIAQDKTAFYESPSSLRFTLTGASTGTLTKALSTQLDLTDYEDVGVTFLAVRLPDGATASNLTSISLKLGSSAFAYDSVSETEGFLDAWTVGEWLLIAFDFSGATSTGTPDWSEIDYVQVSLVHGATLTNVRVGGLWICLPSPHELIFQTSALFLVSGVLARTITDDNDQIVLNDAAYLLYEHESALAVALQQKSKERVAQLRTILYGGEDTQGLYEAYRADNPSQEMRMVGSYYD